MNEMANHLVGPGQTYGRDFLKVNKKAPSQCFNDIMNFVIHPCSYLSFVTECRGYFLYDIFNSETIDLASMIYKKTMFFF